MRLALWVIKNEYPAFIQPQAASQRIKHALCMLDSVVGEDRDGRAGLVRHNRDLSTPE